MRVDVVERTALMNELRGSRKKYVLGKESDVEVASDDDEPYNDDVVISLGDHPIVICVDRSTTLQLKMNDACRNRGRSVVPFISVETAGVHAKLFCDFGPNFVVIDEDGETPRSTLLHRVEEVSNIIDRDADVGVEKFYTIHCVDGERHDVSMGDIIEFHGEQHSDDQGAKVYISEVSNMFHREKVGWSCRANSRGGREQGYERFDFNNNDVLLRRKGKIIWTDQITQTNSFLIAAGNITTERCRWNSLLE